MSKAKPKTGTPGGWREDTLARMRKLILEADPKMVEERKWRKPSNGMAGVTFAKGAFVKDPAGLFNSSLDGNLRRAIDFHAGDALNEKALTALVKAAVKLNVAGRE